MMISFGCHNLTYQCPECEQEIQYSVEVTGELEGNPVDGQVIRMAAEPHTQPIALHYKQAHQTPEPEPEPEPQWTAAEVLKFAYACTESRTPEQGIIYAAKCYAEDNPEWFANWHEHKDANISLAAAAQGAAYAENYAAFNLLNAAAEVAEANPRLFGGAS